MRFRLFIASPIPEEITKEIIKSITLPNYFKITLPENTHITYMFLGDTDKDLIPEIEKKIEKVLKDINSFEISIDSFGQFPEKGNANIIFLTGEKGKDELQKIANLVQNSMQEINIRADKEFKYHITIARNKQKYGKIEPIKLPELKKNYTFKINQVILYKSDLKSSGPVYTKLKVFNLK